MPNAIQRRMSMFRRVEASSSRPRPDPSASTATKLILTGDDHDFDNALYVAPPLEQQMNILYVGDDDPNDAKAMLYYVRQAFGSSCLRKSCHDPAARS